MASASVCDSAHFTSPIALCEDITPNPAMAPSVPSIASETPDVTIVGAGIAGMTAALKLLEAGFSVKVLEASSGIGGKFGAVAAGGGLHDFAWHVFADWYPNFWKVEEAIGVHKERDFAPRSRVTFLRPRESPSPSPRVVTVPAVGSPETFWSTVNSGLAHWSDIVLFGYAQHALLCDAEIDREEFLNRVTVNGYVRSLPYSSDVAALLHNELLLRIWAIPSYLISARSYRTHLALIAPHRTAGSSLLVMRQNFEAGFWRPFLATLARYPRFSLVRNARLTGIRLGASRDRVEAITVRHGGEVSDRSETVRSLIVTIPPNRLTEVLVSPDSLALRQEVPELLGLAKLDSQDTTALTLAFKRKLEIPGVGDEPVSLIDDLESIYASADLAARNGLASEYGLSFLDIAGLRGGDHPTVLTVLASDADTLRGLDDDEASRRILAELRRYVRFDEADLDWTASYYQAHRGEPLFVNSVGSWEYRPEVRLTNSERQPLRGQVWRTIRNLYLAGDYCRSQIDIVSLEGAIHTALWAAHALSRAQRSAGVSGVREVAEPIRPIPADLERARALRSTLLPWASLAARRSRLVKEELLSAAADRPVGVRTPAVTPGPSTRGTEAPRASGGGIMTPPPSTYPTFANAPDTARDWSWLTERQRVRKPVTLKSGAVVSVPVLFWETQAVCVHGLADTESVDLLLRDRGLHARHVDPDDPTHEKSGSGVARVRIWAPNYGGTTVGPIRTTYALIQVQPRPECRRHEKGPLPDHWAWWWYYGDSVVNAEFKSDVWGVPNELAAIDLSYLSPTKIVRVLENGATALRIRCAVTSATTPGQPAPGRADSEFKLIAQRPHDDGENWARVRLGGNVATGDIGAGDETTFYVRRDSTIDRHLRGVGFRAKKWTFFEEYHGIIELWDEKGRGIDEARDLEDRYELVRRGEAWVIREFVAPPATTP
jgi:hypothetical protein